MAISKEESKEAKELLIKLSNNVKGLDENTLNRRVALNVGRDLLLIESFGKELARIFKKGYCVPNKYSSRSKKHNIKRLLSSVISDTHFQSLLTSDEVPLEYKAIQESRRFGAVAQQVADYKTQYRDNTKLLIHLLGDLFQGVLHDARDGAPLATQFGAVVHYLTQFIIFQSANFPEVEVFCSSGNHGRNLSRHKDRAILQKWDSIETMVYIAVKAAIEASNIKNVKFNINKQPYYTVKMFNNTGFFTHGDTVLKPGFPGKNIDTKGLYHQICRWNEARNVGAPFQLFACGHVHFGSIINMPGGVVMLTNGCLVPPDSFALSIGVPDVTCGQYLFESVQDHIVGDQRFIVVDNADTDPYFNTIIKPFNDI